MAAQVEKVYRFENAEQEIGLVGAQDSNLKLIEEGMHVALSVGTNLRLRVKLTQLMLLKQSSLNWPL